MSSQKMTLAGRSGLLLWCTGLTLMYQFVVHVLMWRDLPEEEPSEEQCIFNFDAGGVAPSPRCQEAHMFHKWQMAAEEPRSNGTSNGTQLAVEIMVKRSGAEQALKKLALTSAVDSTTTSPMPASMGDEAALLDEAMPLLERIEQAQREMCEEPRHRDYEFCRTLRAKLEADEATRKEGTSEDEAMPLLDRIEHAQQEMCEEFQHRDYEFCKTLRAKFEAKEAKRKEGTSEDETMPLLDRIEHAQQEMCEEPRHQDFEFCKALRAKLEAEEAKRKEGTSEDEAMPLMDRIEHAQQEMCKEPAHKEYSFCKDLQAKLEAKARKQSLATTLQEVSSRAKVMESFVPAAHVHAGQLKEEMKHQVHDLEHDLEHLSHQHKVWQDSFEREAIHALREMCAAPHRRDDPKCKELVSAAEQHHRHNLTQELQEHTAALHAQAERTAAEHAVWEHSFEDEATAFHRKLCEDPERRHRKDCEEFLAAHPIHASKKTGGWHAQSATLEAQMKQLAEKHSSWEHTFEEQIRQVHQKLCEDPSRSQRKDCEGFLAHQASPQPASISRGFLSAVAPQAQSRDFAQDGSALARQAPPSPGRGLRGSAPPQRDQLQWSSVAESVSSRTGFGAGRLVFQPGTLRQASWVGGLPKVACITALPPGQVTSHGLSEFVESFQQQTAKYGGPTQLVLVYHFEDEKAADLVKLYADGAFVKGIAARGADEFPSAADLRFGAWSAAEDAKVLVHVDFEASHSIERFSLQVRAMASSGRPASLLQGAGWRQEGSPDDTIAGERTFIWKHWYPRPGKPQEPLGIADGKLAIIDMKEHRM